MQIPRYTISGENLKKYILDTLRSILDYLHASKVRPGYGINVDETPSGTIISLAKSASSGASGFVGNATGATGITSSVTGGTASVSLTGGTGSVKFVGTGSVNISGNTNTGNIEINGTGGGTFPNLDSVPDASFTLNRVTLPTQSFIASANGFLYVYSNFQSGAAYPEQLDVNVVIGGSTFGVYTLSTDGHDFALGTGSGCSLPVVSGSTVTGQIVATAGAGESPDFIGSAVFRFYT